MKNGKEGIVREIMMGSPVTLKSDDTLDLANDVISLGRIRHIPIVESGKLVGLLSDRDLLGAAATQIFGLKQRTKSALLKATLIKDVMKKDRHRRARYHDHGCGTYNGRQKNRLLTGAY